MGRSESKNDHYDHIAILCLKNLEKKYMKSRNGLCVAIFFVICSSVFTTLVSHFLIVLLNILYLYSI